jgi:hypothetical protein
MFSINHESNMLRAIQVQINEQMKQAAEPVIQQALKDIEVEMRKKLGAMLISLIEQNFRVETRSNDLVITVKQAMR